MKYSAEEFSKAGDQFLGRSYEEMDCQALVERMMLNHASNQLWLFWHACYSEERLYLSKNEYVERMGNQMGPFEHEPKDSDFAIRAGYADCGEPVFEFVLVLADQAVALIDAFVADIDVVGTGHHPLDLLLALAAEGAADGFLVCQVCLSFRGRPAGCRRCRG